VVLIFFQLLFLRASCAPWRLPRLSSQATPAPGLPSLQYAQPAPFRAMMVSLGLYAEPNELKPLADAAMWVLSETARTTPVGGPLPTESSATAQSVDCHGGSIASRV